MPSAQREDLRYGDPHLNRGDHPIYGPDKFAMLESHGFYLAHEEPPHDSLWTRIKRSLIVRPR
jgi:hypothetical protein